MSGRGFDASKAAVVAFFQDAAFRTSIPSYESTQQRGETNRHTRLKEARSVTNLLDYPVAKARGARM